MRAVPIPQARCSCCKFIGWPLNRCCLVSVMTVIQPYRSLIVYRRVSAASRNKETWNIACAAGETHHTHLHQYIAAAA